MRHDWKETKSGFRCSRCPLRKREVRGKTGVFSFRFESGGGRGPVFAIHPKMPPCRGKNPIAVRDIKKGWRFDQNKRKNAKRSALGRLGMAP